MLLAVEFLDAVTSLFVLAEVRLVLLGVELLLVVPFLSLTLDLVDYVANERLSGGDNSLQAHLRRRRRR